MLSAGISCTGEIEVPPRGMASVTAPLGGYVADTPGIRELGLWEVDQTMLANAFPEFREPAESCRFAPSCRAGPSSPSPIST